MKNINLNFKMSAKYSSSGNPNLNQPQSVVLPNFILLFALIYFLFVITESVDIEGESSYRKLFYYVLLLLDILTLLYINAEHYLVNKIKITLKEYLRNFMKKPEKKEHPDEIRNFVE